MINSDFDTIIRSDNNFSNKKKSKLLIFIIIFILILVIVSGLFAYRYYAEYQANIPKIKFFEYIDDTNANKITDITLFETLGQKISSSSFKTNNELTFESQGEIINLPIIEFNYSKDSNNANSGELILKKSEDDELIKFSLLYDNENIGIKSDDVVIKYVGSKIENLEQLKQKIYLNETIQQANLDFLELDKIDNPTEDFWDKYKNIINNKLTEDKFSIEENVLLTQNESSIQTTLYELKISKEEVLQLLTDLKNQLVLDESLINCFVTGTQTAENDKYINILKLLNGYKMNYTVEQVIEKIEVYFNDMYSKISSDEKIDYIYLDIYVKDETVVKKSIKIGNYFEIYLEEQEKSENENFAKITCLLKSETDKSDAVIFSINRLDNNVSTIIDSEVSIIEKGTTNKKVSINFTLEGNESSTNLTSNLKYSYSNVDAQVIAKLNSNLQFGNEEQIENLNSENCLFLDELDDQVFNDVLQQITVKLDEVIKTKKQEFLQEDLVVENKKTLDGFVNMDAQSEENKKQKAQEKLITAISKEMEIAEQENREYALSDLQTLQIEGATVSVMVGENLAIVAIDGYTFYIDPNFVLTIE